MAAPRTSTERFSDRVENYVRYRPMYPAEVVGVLQREIGLSPSWAIADVGSGTGISAELFLRNGNEVFGIEPNEPMRRAAERLLAEYPGFHSVAGTAEATTLPTGSVDCVVAAQAFHWFDPAKAHVEAARILRLGRCGVLLWNTRKLGGTPFLAAYEQLLIEFGTDYQQVRHDNVGAERLTEYFGGRYEKRLLTNEQRLDLAGLRGRILSSSYAPAAGDARYPAFSTAMDQIFADHQTAGVVRLEYETEIYWGRFA